MDMKEKNLANESLARLHAKLIHYEWFHSVGVTTENEQLELVVYFKTHDLSILRDIPDMWEKYHIIPKNIRSIYVQRDFKIH